ncbi:MAG: competence/damage-inducible protein A [Bacteroidales bacterium]|jgi:nicotinamide-nucleotide amidase|nr:competence/damage-inducible protein A [Bacteroidales bacterium]
MKANIITIGDEILIGQIIDTNSGYIAKNLNSIGIAVDKMFSCSDEKAEIIETLDFALKHADIVFITGGLCPTNDDITKTTLCEYFNSNLILDSQILDFIKKRYDSIGVNFTENNQNQALIPDNAKIFKNEIGSAQCMMFSKDKKIIFSLPGVPVEMIHIFDNELFPYLKENYSNDSIKFKNLLIVDISESALAEKIKNWENSLPEFLKVAYLPSYGYLKLRISCYNTDKKNYEILENKFNEVKEIISDKIISEEDISIEELLGKLLKEENATISTAESCTGGKIASMLTSVPGSSEYFKGSVVAYDNEVKTNVLNVDEECLKKYGAVSLDTVEKMAVGVKNLLKTDFSIATSGIAGPTGGTSEKPVGTVCISVATKENVYIGKFFFNSNRTANILRAANLGIIKLIKILIYEKIKR